jgi:hypothetical protein
MRFPARLNAIFFCLLLIALLGLPNWAGAAESTVAGVIEAPLLLLGSWIAVQATRRAYMRGPLGHRGLSVACGLVVLFLVGQMAKSKKAYPFLPMRMYGTEAEETAQFLVYEAKLSDGSTRKLRLGAAVPELGTARLARGLERRLSSMSVPLGAVEQSLSEAQREGIAMLRWLILQENQMFTAAQPAGKEPVLIREVAVYQMTLRPPYTARHRSQTLLVRVSVHPS